jgi:hypothetical protein
VEAVLVPSMSKEEAEALQRSARVLDETAQEAGL